MCGRVEAIKRKRAGELGSEREKRGCVLAKTSGSDKKNERPMEKSSAEFRRESAEYRKEK